MTNTWTNREMIKRYFSGMTEIESELIARAPAMHLKD